MSGIEVAGLVLGAFPILLNCLEYYRRGFEPLDEWWNFHPRFIAFVDAIRHQMMRFRENLIRLLDPIITDNEDLDRLVGNAADPRWRNESLHAPLRRRLASELDRFLRTIERMHQVTEKLNALLQIEGDRIAWIGNDVQDLPWQWHFQRLCIAFSKSKHKKVRMLGEYNQQLEEILGYSERLMPITARRGSSSPAKRLDKVRQHALCLFNALCQSWTCSGQNHQAHLKVRHDATAVDLEMLFIVGCEGTPGGPKSQLKAHEVTVRRQPEPVSLPAVDISYVKQSLVLASAQEMSEQQETHRRERPSLPLRLSEKFRGKGSFLTSSLKKTRSPSSISSLSPSFQLDAAGSVVAHGGFVAAGMSVELTTIQQATQPPTPPPGNSAIQDICGFLGDPALATGSVKDAYNRVLALEKKSSQEPRPLAGVTATVPTLISLHKMLDAYYKEVSIELPRQTRFQMAAHIASALLQTHDSPWLSSSWSKHDFYFLIDPITQELKSNHPFVSRTFPIRADGPIESAEGTQVSEEITKQCLLQVGVMIMELVFGCNIEDCLFYKRHCGGEEPNDRGYVDSAKRWLMKLSSESGPKIAGVVKRCLDHYSFGVRPCLSNPKFRMAVYEDIIEPLEKYSENWADDAGD